MRASSLRSKAGESLGVFSFPDCRLGYNLGGCYGALTASSVKSYFYHDLPPFI
jgi:hypothetical protein